MRSAAGSTKSTICWMTRKRRLIWNDASQDTVPTTHGLLAVDDPNGSENPDVSDRELITGIDIVHSPSRCPPSPNSTP